jgi:hypothetical protein
MPMSSQCPTPKPPNAPPKGYVFFLAPNQTPTIDMFIVQKLVGLKQEDPYQVGHGRGAACPCPYRARLWDVVGAGRGLACPCPY